MNKEFAKQSVVAGNISLLLVSLTLLPLAQRCSAFEIVGTTKMESITTPGGTAKPFVGEFKIRFSNGAWEISHQWNKAAVSELVVCDGTNTYAITGDIGKNVNASAMDTNGPATVTANIFPGALPWGASPHIRFLWRTFISGQAGLSTSLTSFPAPWSSSYIPEARGFSESVRWNDGNPRFPASIVFTGASENWSNAVKELQSLSAAVPAAPFADGFIGGEQRVTEWGYATNQSESLQYPAKIVCERFFYPQLARAQTNQVAERLIATVQSFRPDDRSVNKPEISSHVQVSDYRFRDASLPWFYVQYEIPDGVWRETNDTLVTQWLDHFRSNYVTMRSKQVYGSASPAPNRDKSGQQKLRRIVVLAVLSLSIIPIIAVAFRIRRKDHVPSKTK